VGVLNQILCLGIICLLVVGLAPISIAKASDSDSLNIFPPESNPYGLSYSEHVQNFWRWILEIPAKDSPRNDATGERCSISQPNTSSIFYLSPNSGGKSERICEVPVGKALFIPIMQVEYSDLELLGASVEQLSASAKKDQDSVNSLYLKIDDREYKYDELIKYRTHTDGFDTTWPDNALFGVVKGGNSTVVADGFYVLTEPLAKGNHTIHFKSSLICSDPDCGDPNFVQDINYIIISE
jgi:hypothetical protein